MEVTTTVKINLSGVERYARELGNKTEKVYKQWAIRYRSFIQRRFDKFSRGAGDWAPLKFRKGTILRDTNTLFTAMSPTFVAPPGSINKLLDDGVEVGFAGTASHKGGPTIAQIAYWHHTGAGNNPVRKIIVEPDAATLSSMVGDMRRALEA